MKAIDGDGLEQFFLHENKRLIELLEDADEPEKDYIKTIMPTVEWARKTVHRWKPINITNQEWINANNPPKEHGEYIVHIENLTGFHVLDRNVFEATYAFGQWIFDGCSDNRVTNWMHLPKPPERRNV